jgi:hypothetical protein
MSACNTIEGIKKEHTAFLKNAKQKGPSPMSPRMIMALMVAAALPALAAGQTELLPQSQSEIRTVWNPPPASGNPAALWTDAANWTGQIPDGGPNADYYKVVFSISGARECILDQTRVVRQLVQGDHGPGGILRITNGGHLTSGWYTEDGQTKRVWTGIGWCNTATLIVEQSGQLSVGDHLWIALPEGSDGTLIIDGGTVTVAHQLGLNWENHPNSSARILLYDGQLNVENWTENTIGINSFLDIHAGSVQISGDRRYLIEPMIADGRIRAYRGRGKIIIDYNASAPGKTSLKAIPPIAGDLNNDAGVDFSDLLILAKNWLVYDCDHPANLTPPCRVNMPDFAILAKHWQRGIVAHWHIAQTAYPTDDWIVTPISAEQFGIIADGTTDVTDAIQKALIFLDNIGGGTLFLPSGMYRVEGTLRVPSRVTIRGDWHTPNPNGPITGTILMAYAGRGQDDPAAAPFIGLSNGAGLKGLTFWYPQQTADAIQPYPPTIAILDGSNQSAENITFVNAYIGFSTFQNGRITASPFLRNIYGTPLKTGIELDCLADVGRIESVHFSPAYWQHCGLDAAPQAGEHTNWLYNNAFGLVLGRIDWSYAAYVTVEGYAQGLRLQPTRNTDNPGSTPNGQCYRFDLINCKTAVHIEAIASVGFMMTRFHISGSETGLYLASSANGQALIHTCSIDGANYAINNDGTGILQIISSTFSHGEIRLHRGYASIVNSDFTQPAGRHILINYAVKGATFQGNRFSRAPNIAAYSPNPVLIDHTPVSVASLPAYEFRKPTRPFTPAKDDMFIVTAPPYNAAKDGTTDVTAQFQDALDDAGANGGGIVFVPGGDYRLEGTLTVPTGVELRGIYDLPHSPSSRGSVLNTYHGKNQPDGTPFIQIHSGAGIRGLTIHNAGQIYDPSDTVNYGMTPYPFMIRGLGADVYVIHIASTLPWQLLDLATYRCDRHYVDSVLGTAMKTGIHVGGGSVDGRVYNCQLNPSSYVFQRHVYDSIPTSGDLDGVYQLAWHQAVPYKIGDVTGQILHQNFVFGGYIGAHLLSENGRGPSGQCLGLGIDQCTTAIGVDSIGTHGLDMINSQIVTVDYRSGRYLETGSSLTSPFRMFSTCCWGGSERGIRINGGNVELQLCQVENWGWVVDTAYQVGPSARLRTIGSNHTQPLNTLLQLDPNGWIEVIANMLNIDTAAMPVENGSNLRARGNIQIH